MNFILTQYIYPIKEPIILSKRMNIILDNPRTEEEINRIGRLIQISHEKSEFFRLPPYHKDKRVMSWDYFIKTFIEKFSKNDEYVKEIARTYKSKNFHNVYEFLAKIWIIARFDDKNESEKLEKLRKEHSVEGEAGFFLLEDDSPIIAGAKQLVDYSYLFSLLFPKKQNVNRTSFLLHDRFAEMSTTSPQDDISREVMFFGLCVEGHGRPNRKEDNYYLFPFAKNDLIGTAQLIDEAYSIDKEARIPYISNLLKIATFDTDDDKLKIVVLVSIIELLLTHNPNYNRFNVEDSITKQFVLKTGILLYLNNKKNDINKIREKLQDLYRIRSNIAHGNLKSAEQLIIEALKKYNYKYLDSYVEEIKKYVRVVILSYIKDKSFVDFLKAN